MAAYRAGLREVILPASNEKDLREVPDEVRTNMTFSFVQMMDDVLRIALLPASTEPPADRPPARETEQERRTGLADRPVPIRTTG